MFERFYTRKVVKMSEVKDRERSWLWNPYIPFGAVTVFHGEPGVGKSMFMAKLLGYCTNRQEITPDGNQMEPRNALLLTGEEDLSLHEKHRQRENGVDLDKVFVINDSIPIMLSDNSLEILVKENDIGLVIIDPIQEYLETSSGMSDDFKSYPIMDKLARLARKYGCAVVLVSDTEDLSGNDTYTWEEMYNDCVDSVLRLEDDYEAERQVKHLIHERSAFSVEGKDLSYRLAAERGFC